MITLEFEAETSITFQYVTFCYVMWVCPHRSFLDIIPHSLVPRLTYSFTKIPFALKMYQSWNETKDILAKSVLVHPIIIKGPQCPHPGDVKEWMMLLNERSVTDSPQRIKVKTFDLILL